MSIRNDSKRWEIGRYFPAASSWYPEAVSLLTNTNRSTWTESLSLRDIENSVSCQQRVKIRQLLSWGRLPYIYHLTRRPPVRTKKISPSQANPRKARKKRVVYPENVILPGCRVSLFPTILALGISLRFLLWDSCSRSSWTTYDPNSYTWSRVARIQTDRSYGHNPRKSNKTKTV